MPKSEIERKQVASDFKNLWNFDNCLGAMDGKHIVITKSPKNGSFYYNYKGTFSFGEEYQMVVFSEKQIFFRLLENNELQIPTYQRPPLVVYDLPYVFIGDEAFPLMKNLMKPYSKHCPGYDEHIFNYRLSRT